jgi:hypothetical protein
MYILNRKTLWSFHPKLVNELGNRIGGNLDSALKLPDSLHKWLLYEYHQKSHTQPFPVSLAPLIYEGLGFLSVSMLYQWNQVSSRNDGNGNGWSRLSPLKLCFLFSINHSGGTYSSINSLFM